jgi:hypothetical protein
MAEKNEEFDRIFREKLENHQAKPSAAAWEKLEYQLPEPRPSQKGLWWAIAASVSIILATSWMVWVKSEQSLQNPQSAQVTDLPKEKPEDQLVTTLPDQPKQPLSEPIQNQRAVNKPIPTKIKNESPEKTKTNSPEIKVNEQNQSILIASTETVSEEKNVVNASFGLETHSDKLPETIHVITQHQITETFASKEDAPLYRVSIYSDGLKKSQEPNKNLITEMGKTVGKVENLLGKVDEGFVELQDKKNSLFATLTSRKQTEDQ